MVGLTRRGQGADAAGADCGKAVNIDRKMTPGSEKLSRATAEDGMNTGARRGVRGPQTLGNETAERRIQPRKGMGKGTEMAKESEDKPIYDDPEVAETETEAEDDEAEGTDEAEGDGGEADEEAEAEAEDKADEGEAEDGDAELGRRAQRRIGRLTGKVKDLERRLAEAQALAGDDGKAILAAAEAAGVLPGLMSREEAKGIAAIEEKTKAAKYVKGLLRSDDDEFEIGGETRSRRWLEGELDDLNEELGELRERFGAKRRELAQRTREIIELGMAAVRHGWRPGERKGTTRPAAKARSAGAQRKGLRPAAEGGRKRIDWSAVNDEATAESMILAELEN